VAAVRRLPLTVQAAYSDLLARLQDDALLQIGGTPVLRDRGGRKYWYAVQRLAAGPTVERYLGPDTSEIRARVAQVRQINENARQRADQRSLLARMCRGAGLPRVDAQTGKVLLALANAGLFGLRAVLVGTDAFRCYPALLGVAIPEAHAVTEDIGIAAFRSIAVALDDRLDPASTEALQRIGPFLARPSLHEHPTTWRDRDSGAVVELLTPNEGPDRDQPLELPALGAWAQPFRFLDYLIHQPIQAAVLHRAGVLVNIPQPARYAVHKLIVAIRRTASAAARATKDIEQAAAMIRVLADDRPDELADALVDARNRGPAWRDSIDRGIGRLPQDARSGLEGVIQIAG
jgi:hypothetical protein